MLHLRDDILVNLVQILIVLFLIEALLEVALLECLLLGLHLHLALELRLQGVAYALAQQAHDLFRVCLGRHRLRLQFMPGSLESDLQVFDPKNDQHPNSDDGCSRPNEIF